MKLKADFYGDWINVLKDVLSNEWECDISSISDTDIPYVYFNTKNRRPSQKKREVVLADTFVCPKDLELGFKRLISRVENGYDLTKNLSKKVFFPQRKDLMLNDWHVHHFHLNENTDGSFEKGSKFLVFAWLVNNKFYVIGIFPHNDWVNQEVIETMHRNWPLELDCYKLSYDNEDMAYRNKNCIAVCDDVDLSRVSKDSLQEKREKGEFTPVVTDDETIYIFSHRIFEVHCFTSDQKYVLNKLEKRLTDILKHIKTDLEKLGYDGTSALEAYMEGTDTHYIAIFPKYRISVSLMPKSEYVIPGFEKRCCQLSDDALQKTVRL